MISKKLTFILLICLFTTNLFAQNLNFETLEKLYPDQDKSFLKTRIKNATNLLMFFRSFTRLDYLIYKNYFLDDQTFKTLKNFNGVMVGDPHLENFGLVVDQKPNSFFFINDYDEVTYGPIFLDIIHHLNSVTFAGIEINIKKYMEYYLNGLSNKHTKMPPIILEMSMKAKNLGFTTDLKDINQDENKFKKYIPSVLSHTQKEKAANSKLISLMIPKSELIDFYKRMKESGGSAGKKRYLSLIKSKNFFYTIEAKEEATPSYNFIHQVKAKNKFENLKIITPLTFLKTLTTLTSESKNYLVRYLSAGNLDFSKDDFKDSEASAIIYFEAYTLGKIHAKSLTNVNKYTEKLIAIPPTQIKEMSDEIAETIANAYKKLIN